METKEPQLGSYEGQREKDDGLGVSGLVEGWTAFKVQTGRWLAGRRQGKGHSRWLLAVFMLLAAGSMRESIGPRRGGVGLQGACGSGRKLREE